MESEKKRNSLTVIYYKLEVASSFKLAIFVSSNRRA